MIDQLLTTVTAMKNRKINSYNCIQHRCFNRSTIVRRHGKRICIVYTRQRDRVFSIKLNTHAIHLFQEKRSVDERCSATSCRNFRYVAATGKICMIYPSDNAHYEEKIYIYNILEYKKITYSFSNTSFIRL